MLLSTQNREQTCTFNDMEMSFIHIAFVRNIVFSTQKALYNSSSSNFIFIVLLTTWVSFVIELPRTTKHHQLFPFNIRPLQLTWLFNLTSHTDLVVRALNMMPTF